MWKFFIIIYQVGPAPVRFAISSLSLLYKVLKIELKCHLEFNISSVWYEYYNIKILYQYYFVEEPSRVYYL